MSTDRSFWMTLPGILTAFAAVVTAVGGILGFLVKAQSAAESEHSLPSATIVQPPAERPSIDVPPSTSPIIKAPPTTRPATSNAALPTTITASATTTLTTITVSPTTSPTSNTAPPTRQQNFF